MFCSKCGRRIEDGSRFCPFCGETQASMQSEPRGEETPVYGQDGLLWGMSAVDIGICAVFIILILWWSGVFFKNLKYTWTAFEFLSADAKFLGTILYIIPYIQVLVISAAGIFGICRHEYHISTGAVIVAIGVIMKIGTFFFDEASYQSYAIIALRTFGVYGAIGLSTVVLGIILCGLIYSKMNAQR